jgi:preprotein translocase subunit SecG
MSTFLIVLFVVYVIAVDNHYRRERKANEKFKRQAQKRAVNE